MDKITKNCIYLFLLLVSSVLGWFITCMHEDLLSDSNHTCLFNVDIMTRKCPWLFVTLIFATGMYYKDIYYENIKIGPEDFTNTTTPTLPND